MTDLEDKDREELQVGDMIQIEGHLDVSGLIDGHEYRLEAIENFKDNVTLYTFRDITLDLQLKCRKDKVDRVLGREHSVDVKGSEELDYSRFILKGL